MWYCVVEIAETCAEGLNERLYCIREGNWELKALSSQRVPGETIFKKEKTAAISFEEEKRIVRVLIVVLFV
jgi:hypothetical protein